MTAVNPVYMSPDLASLVEITFGAANTLDSIDRVIVRWRSGATEIEAQRFNTGATGLFALARRLLIGPGWQSIGSNAFQGWSSALELTLPASLATIGNNAFYGWSSATSLTLPASLTSVGNTAFYGWSSALELTLPASLTSVGNQAFFGWSSATRLALAEGHPGTPNLTTGNNAPFRDWTALKTIDLPASVESLGNGLTHASMTQLETIIVRAETPPTITTTTFTGIPATTQFYAPDASVAAYQAAANWSTYAARIHPLSELP